MLRHSNIERSNSQLESKAPFTFESTLLVNGMQIPHGGFLSIKVYVDSTVALPVRIYCIRQNGDVVFCDRSGSIVAIWKTKPLTQIGITYVTDFLVTEYGVIAGSIACTVQALEIFRGVIDSGTSDFYLPADAFVLIPQCHIAMMSGAVKSIQIEDKDGAVHTFTEDITITGYTPASVLQDEEDTLRESVVVWNGTGADIKNKYETVLARQQKNGICSIIVNGSTTACDGKRLIIKARMTPQDASNLRVVHSGNQLILRGVKDA